MTPYIKNLTDEMIKKGGFDEAAQTMPEDKLVEHVRSALFSAFGPIKKYNPNTLMRILSEFEHGDPGKHVSFTFEGDRLKAVRALVALCLAHMICARLLHADESKVAPFEKKAGAQA